MKGEIIFIGWIVLIYGLFVAVGQGLAWWLAGAIFIGGTIIIFSPVIYWLARLTICSHGDFLILIEKGYF